MTVQDRLRALDARVIGSQASQDPVRGRKSAKRNIAVGPVLIVVGLVIRLAHPLPPLEVAVWIGGVLVVGASVVRLRRLTGE